MEAVASRDRSPTLVAGSLAIAGCLSRSLSLDPEASSTTDASSDATATASPDPIPPMPPDPATSGAPPPVLTTDNATIGDGGGDFIPAYDVFRSFECDVFQQDCPVGEKCVPYDAHQNGSWSSTACVPVARDPAGVGDACAVRGFPMSGLDDCDVGSICWGVSDDLVGVCEDLCTGSADDPTCEDPDDICTLAGGDEFGFCLAACDPLAQACALPDDGCYPVGDAWACMPAGRDGYGQSCEYINACAIGHLCIGTGAFAGCEGGIGCCSIICDIADEGADATCAALEPFHTCVSWYRGVAPDGYESIGVCASSG